MAPGSGLLPAWMVQAWRPVAISVSKLRASRGSLSLMSAERFRSGWAHCTACAKLHCDEILAPTKALLGTLALAGRCSGAKVRNPSRLLALVERDDPRALIREISIQVHGRASFLTTGYPPIEQ